MFYVRTHLGTYLNPGDYALGYDLTSQNFNEADLGGLRGRQVPDVVRAKYSPSGVWVTERRGLTLLALALLFRYWCERRTRPADASRETATGR
jgi:hypothetical protein